MSGTASDYHVEPGQEVEIDLFRPEDAEGVAGCFRTVYGDGYPVKTYYEPDRLVEANRVGSIISSVARTRRGEVVGHDALFRSAPHELLYEIGAGLVLPEYRATAKLLTRMVEHGVTIAPTKYPVDAIFGEPVCNHIYTQKMGVTIGSATCAVEVDLLPAAAYAKEKSSAGRVSALIDFYKDVRPRPQTAYLPEPYEELLQYCYAGLQLPRELSRAPHGTTRVLSSAIRVQRLDFAQVARTAVTTIGADFVTRVDKLVAECRASGISLLELYLPLARPVVADATEDLRVRGFFFGGLLPRWFDDDAMLMQKVFGEPNWDGIQLFTDRAKKIVEAAHTDWQRARDRG